MKTQVIADAYDANYAVVLEQRGTRKLLMVRYSSGGCWHDGESYPASAGLARELTNGMSCAAPTIERLVEAAG